VGKRISIWLELGKVRITAAVSITTVAGYLLCATNITLDLLWTVIGIFLLASGASALNQIQESEYDRRMERTSKRPIPAGCISRGAALLVTLVYIIAGSLILLAGSGLTGMLMGWLAFFWYNVVYTYLKRITAWAVVPGSVIGSIPPVIGWISAGGSLADISLMAVAGFFFIWQVPHFWLLSMKYGREYEKAGFPTLKGSMTQLQMGRMIFFWVLGTAAVTVLFSLMGPLESLLAKVGLWISAAWLLYTFAPALSSSIPLSRPGHYFMRINYFVLLSVIFMCLDKLLLLRIESWF